MNDTAITIKVDAVPVKIVSSALWCVKVCLYQRHEAGSLSLDDPITKLAPEYMLKWPHGSAPSKRSGSLRDLGSHMAGLARYMPCTFGSQCNISLDVALSRLNNWTLLFEPGSRLTYSNTGFGLLGNLLARHDGLPFAEMLGSLAAELGLQATSVEPPKDLAQLAYGYSPDGTRVPLAELGITDPAGGIYATADDMSKLLSFLLRDGASRGPGQPLDSATVRSWLNTRAWQNPSVVPEGIWFTEWGVPWQVLTANLPGVASLGDFSRFYLVSKDGSIPGYNAQMVLQPDTKLGLYAAMTTGAGGRSVPFFSDVLVELGLRIVPKMVGFLSTVQPSPLPPSPRDYFGLYESGDGLKVAVDFGPGNLTLALVSNNIGLPPMQPLGWVRGDAFEMVPLPGAQCWTIEGGENYPLTFSRTASSAFPQPVAALTLQGIGEFPAVLRKVGQISDGEREAL